jgi:hypothetical protein
MGDQNYDAEQDIAAFFTKTTATRSACDLRARELVDGELQLVPIQGACSYTLYAGPKPGTSSEPGTGSVIQFRLKSLALPSKTVKLAREVYGKLAPKVVELESHIGEDDDDDDGREALIVYLMPRMEGITRLDFVLAYGYPEDSPKICGARLALIKDVAT